MAWLIAGLVFGVVAVTWFVAEGRFGEFVDHVDDRPVPRLPEGDLTADDLAAVRFATAPRGYHPAQVRDFLARVGAGLGGDDAAAAQPVSAREVSESTFDLVAFGASSSQVDEVLARLAHQLSRPVTGAEAPGYGRMDDEHLPGKSEEVQTWQQ